MLLLAAATLGHACTAQLLLLLQQGAAAVKGGPEWWDPTTPLHLAAQRGFVDVIRAILAAMPAATRLSAVKGRLLLHEAAEEAEPAAVQLLLQADPASALCPMDGGKLPIHLAAGGCVRVGEQEMAATLRLLLAAAPETAAAVCSSDYGWSPLHLASIKGFEAAVRVLLEAAPAMAAVGDEDGSLPAHLTIDNAAEDPGGSAAILKLLLEAAPETAAAQDKDGRTPLHAAAAEGAEDLVRLLLAANPAAAGCAAMACCRFMMPAAKDRLLWCSSSLMLPRRL